MKIGVAGCGRMGLPMAKALRRAQVDVTGFDVRQADAFDGVDMEFDPGRFAKDLAVLFTVVRDEAETDALLFDRQAILSHASSLETLVICSTLSPSYIRSLADRLPKGMALIDAPMSGAAIAAEEARLTFILGGEAAEIDQIMLLLAAMGDTFHHLGPVGAGMTAKVLNNLVAAASVAATRTALDWALDNGLDHRRLLTVMNDSSGQTWFGSEFDAIEFARDGYAPGNTIGTLVKDLDCALSAAPMNADTALPKVISETLLDLRGFSARATPSDDG